jgi:outer membrane receptor protein involved in Fe transport
VTPRFSTSVDYYRITHRQRIDTPSATFLVANEDLFPDGVTRDPRTPNDILAGTRGPIVGQASDDRIGLRRFYFNASSQATRGVDVEFRYRQPLSSWGTLSLSSINTYVDYFRRSVAPGQPAIELAGNDRLPRYKGVHTALWNVGPWDTAATVNVVGRYNQPLSGPNGETLNVTSWTTLDLQASFKGFRNLKLTAGVNNVFDRDPPFYNNESSGGYDTFTHSIIGRFYYGRVTLTFR